MYHVYFELYHVASAERSFRIKINYQWLCSTQACVSGFATLYIEAALTRDLKLDVILPPVKQEKYLYNKINAEKIKQN